MSRDAIVSSGQINGAGASTVSQQLPDTRALEKCC